MKILVLTSTFPRWNNDIVPNFIFELCSILSESHDLSVLAPHFKGSARDEIMDKMRVHRFFYAPSSLEVVAYGGGISDNLRLDPKALLIMPLFLIGFLLSTMMFSIMKKPDIIHCHWILPSGLVGILVGKLLNIPCIVTAHGTDVFGMSDSKIRSFLSRFVLHSSNKVTGNSIAVCEQLISLGADRERTSLIPMGVDLSAFKPTQREFHDGLCRIIYVGRLVEVKGIDVLIQAFHTVINTGKNAKIVIVGDGPIKGQLESQVERLGISSIVEFRGSVPHYKIPELLKESDLLVLPSRKTASGAREGFGLVIIEAMASGVPVIASRIGGIVDIIDDEINGVLVEPDDPYDLAVNIVRLFNDDEYRNKLARNGLLKSKKYSWISIAKEFSDLFSKLRESTSLQIKNKNSSEK